MTVFTKKFKVQSSKVKPFQISCGDMFNGNANDETFLKVKLLSLAIEMHSISFPW